MVIRPLSVTDAEAYHVEQMSYHNRRPTRYCTSSLIAPDAGCSIRWLHRSMQGLPIECRTIRRNPMRLNGHVVSARAWQRRWDHAILFMHLVAGRR
jgi:hypothetical protein